MSDQKILALRRILEIDAELEPLEDSLEPIDVSEHSRYITLKNQLFEAEQAYYKLSGTGASPWSLVTQIVEQARAASLPELPVQEPHLIKTLASDAWFGPYM